jgi:hypothetical protein
MDHTQLLEKNIPDPAEFHRATNHLGASDRIAWVGDATANMESCSG